MKPELEETKYIEYYLLNKLSEEEKNKFELKMANDSKFADKVKMQQILMKRVRLLSIKQSVAIAHRSFLRKQRFSFSNKVFRYSFISIVIVISVIIIYYLSSGIKSSISENKNTNIESGILPPLKGIDVPYITNIIIAENGAVINYKTGSSIIVPSNAFIDESGNSITGEVELKFREFKDVTDIYLAGIPMDYELDGENLVLESAAMCEINGYKDGKPIKIKQGKNIEIMQAGYTGSNAFNLYRLNKKGSKWIKKGKDISIDLYDEEIKNSKANLIVPVKPQNANDFKYSFTVNFNNKKFPELSVYKDVEFGVDLNDKSYNLSNSEVLWESIYLKKGRKAGSFKITFTKGQRKVSYLVYPIFRGENLDNAKKIYNKNLREYYRIRNKRLQNEEKSRTGLILAKQIEERNEEVKLYNKWFESDESRLLYIKWNEIMMSQIVEINIKDKLSKIKKNKDFIQRNSNLIEKTFVDLGISKGLYRKRNMIISQSDDNMLVSKLVIINAETKELISNKDFIEISYNKFKKEKLNSLPINKKIQRIYKIDRFGIWNCDQPIRYPIVAIVKAKFQSNNKRLPLNEINLVNKDIRTIYRYKQTDFKKFKFNPKANNVIWTVINNKQLIYFNEFNSIPENIKGEVYTFKMKEIKEPLTDYEKVREIIKNL